MKIASWLLAPYLAADTTGGERLRVARDRIFAGDPDVVCLSEADTSVALPEGHAISAKGPDGGELLLWSRTPWSETIDVAPLLEFGAAAGGVTSGATGPVRVIGVHVPNWRANLPGKEPRAANWELHIAFLEQLAALLRALPDDMPLIIAGEFNQQIPLRWGLQPVQRAFDDAFQGLSMITRGDLPPMNAPSTQHIAVSKSLRARRVRGLDRFDGSGRPFADQPGVFVELEAGGVQIFD